MITEDSFSEFFLGVETVVSVVVVVVVVAVVDDDDDDIPRVVIVVVDVEGEKTGSLESEVGDPEG